MILEGEDVIPPDPSLSGPGPITSFTQPRSEPRSQTNLASGTQNYSTIILLYPNIHNLGFSTYSQIIRRETRNLSSGSQIATIARTSKGRTGPALNITKTQYKVLVP